MSADNLERSAPEDAREMEWQLAAPDLGSVRRWLADHDRADGLVLEPQSTLQIFDTYFDTDDWRIHRAGFALRVRSESGRTEATLKSLHSASEEVADRRELTEEFNGNALESIRLLKGPVGTRVDAVSGEHELQALFEVRTSRQRYAIHAPDEDRQLGEIALDETTISRPHGDPQTSMQRVEVESHIGTIEPLRALVKALRSDCALESAPDSKYSQGLKTVGLAPASVDLTPVALDISMRIEEVALANLRRYLSAWHVNEPGARLGDDPEALHELRIAGRRIEAILGQLKEFLPAVLQPVRQTLKKLLRVLGDARDFDIALSELDIFAATLLESERASVEPLRLHLIADRAHARARMLAALDSRSVRDELDNLSSLLREPATVVAAGLARHVAPGLLGERMRKVRKGADRLGPRSAMEAYHEVRRQLKKTRYTLEAVAVIYGKPADEMLRALRRWQDKLGQQQDADVAGRRLRTLAALPPENFPPATLFLMGRFAEHYAGAAHRARKLHDKAYQRVRGKWKKLKARLGALAADPPCPGT